MKHTLTKEEIMSIPAGRIMDTFVQEYVLNEHPSRWSNGQQKELPAHWFEEHPRQIAEDDGGFSSAETIPHYSTDTTHAMSLTTAAALKGSSLNMKTETSKIPMLHSPVVDNWACFFDIPFQSTTPSWLFYWAKGDTMALAICRAALIYTATI